jgi:hypothetical protein
MTADSRPGRRSNRRNLLAGTGEGILATPWAFLSLPGNFVLAALLTQVYQLDTATYGLIASLPAWGNALQIFIIPWLARFLTPKELALGMSWFNIGLWSVFAAVLPHLPAVFHCGNDFGGQSGLLRELFVGEAQAAAGFAEDVVEIVFERYVHRRCGRRVFQYNQTALSEANPRATSKEGRHPAVRSLDASAVEWRMSPARTGWNSMADEEPVTRMISCASCKMLMLAP